MHSFDVIKFIFTLVALLIQGWSIWLCWKQIQFTEHYSKKWASAFIVFFVTMLVTMIRRILILGEFAGIWDGHLRSFLEWADHVIIPTINSIGWCTFLIILTKWWKGFFGRYFPNGIDAGEQNIVQEKEEQGAK